MSLEASCRPTWFFCGTDCWISCSNSSSAAKRRTLLMHSEWCSLLNHGGVIRLQRAALHFTASVTLLPEPAGLGMISWTGYRWNWTLRICVQNYLVWPRCFYCLTVHLVYVLCVWRNSRKHHLRLFDLFVDICKFRLHINHPNPKFFLLPPTEHVMSLCAPWVLIGCWCLWKNTFTLAQWRQLSWSWWCCWVTNPSWAGLKRACLEEGGWTTPTLCSLIRSALFWVRRDLAYIIIFNDYIDVKKQLSLYSNDIW